MNLQPSEAEAGIDIRVPPTADPISLEKRIAEEWAPTSRNMTFEVEVARFTECLIVDYHDSKKMIIACHFYDNLHCGKPKLYIRFH